MTTIPAHVERVQKMVRATFDTSLDDGAGAMAMADMETEDGAVEVAALAVPPGQWRLALWELGAKSRAVSIVFRFEIWSLDPSKLAPGEAPPAKYSEDPRSDEVLFLFWQNLRGERRAWRALITRDSVRRHLGPWEEAPPRVTQRPPYPLFSVSVRMRGDEVAS